MNNLIIDACTWLISHHSLTMRGWCWLLFFPAATLFMAVAAFAISHLAVLAAFHRR